MSSSASASESADAGSSTGTDILPGVATPSSPERPWDCTHLYTVNCCCVPACPLPCYFPPKCCGPCPRRCRPTAGNKCCPGVSVYEVEIKAEDIPLLMRHMHIWPTTRDLSQGPPLGSWYNTTTKKLDLVGLLKAFGYGCRAQAIHEEFSSIQSYVSTL